MPILRKESDLYPDDLFAVPAGDLPWSVVHVRSRQEKLVARFLRTREVPFYLPQVERKVKRAGRTFTSHLPLFPGYVFVRRAPGLETIWQTNVIVAVLDVPDQDRLSEELGQIRLLQEAGATMTPLLPDFVPGDPVRITEGAFRDYVGVVVREKGALRLVVSVSILKKSVAVEFPRELLSPAPPQTSAPRRSARR
jgi:transcription antitermination factor NusG